MPEQERTSGTESKSEAADLIGFTAPEGTQAGGEDATEAPTAAPKRPAEESGSSPTTKRS